MFASVVMAAGTQKGVHEPGTGIEDPGLKEAGQGTGQGVQTAGEVETRNQGEAQQVRVQQSVQARSGDYISENGKQFQIQAQEMGKVRLKAGDSDATSELELTQEQVQEKTRLHAKLSNGRNAEIKIMPDVASERARERLQLKVCSEENGCSIELKEVGKGEQVRAAYEVKAQKEAKVLGLFRTRMRVTSQVDAENGEVIKANKPWWAFLASE